MDKVRYGSGAVFGSLAYDFSNPELYYDEPEQELAAPPEEEEQESSLPAARPRYAVAPMAVMGFAVGAILLIFFLLGHIQLIEASDASLALTAQLEELEREQKRLLIEYESTFNLTEIEAYAIHQLGMQKPSSDQIYFIGGTNVDRAEILSTGEERGFLDRFYDMLDLIGECFR